MATTSPAFSLSIPRLETARLRLREPRLDDFESYAANAADSLARVHIGGPLPRRDAWRRFLVAAGTWVTLGMGWWCIEAPELGLVGMVGVFRRETGPELEIGWGIHRPFWGRGYASEAAGAALRYTMTERRAERVIAMIAPENARSQAVALRIGMRRESEQIDPEFGVYGLYAAGSAH